MAGVLPRRRISRVKVARITPLLGLIAVLTCRASVPAREPTSTSDQLSLYEIVLRAVTADFEVGSRPPVEVRLESWWSPVGSRAPDSALHHWSALPDTFLTRLTRDGVISGICPEQGCHRVPSAISLSEPRAESADVILVQASLAGTGLYEYAAQRERGRWRVIRSQTRLIY
jgi:hypothetical protein